jgi:hypothetical protein
VDPERCLRVAEVQECQVEKIGDKDHLAWPEVIPDPAHDEPKLEEIVQNVVAANIRTAVDILGVGAPEEADVVELENKGYDPVD